MPRDRRKPRERRKDYLTPKQNAFVANFAGNADEAARLAGFKEGSVHNLMRNPLVLDAIRKKQEKMIEAAAKKQVNAATMTRDFILERCAAIASGPPDEKRGYQDHIASMKLGAEVMGLIGKNDGARVPPDNPIQVYKSAWLSESKPAEA